MTLGLTGQVMAAHCDALQICACLPVHPLGMPKVAAAFPRNNFLSHVGHLMHAHTILSKVPIMFQSTDILIASILKPSEYSKVAVQLHADGVMYLVPSQVSTEDGLSLDLWTSIKNRLGLQGVQHKWHMALQKQLCIEILPSAVLNPGDDPEASQSVQCLRL